MTAAWTPFRIGSSQLEHRIVLAPLTRNRGTKSTINPQTWIANDLMKQYYGERATKGGLLITEATPTSITASGLSGIPGLFTQEQQEAWRPIVSEVHDRSSIFFCQLWHQGRTTHSVLIGKTPLCSSAVGLSGQFAWNDVSPVDFEVPHAMTVEEIQATQQEFVQAAQNARAVGFDGIEVHAGNGYLFDQFHHSNINQRTDAYGGSMEARCKFTLETVEKLCKAIGADRVGVRLSPFALFNEAHGVQRVEQWNYLCGELEKFGLAYVHLIEPRFDEFKSAADKFADLPDVKAEELTLAPFRKTLRTTPVIAAGGFGPDNYEDGITQGQYDLVAFGRFFVANGDLIERLRNKQQLYKWDRSRFYGPFEDNEMGYTVHSNRIFAEAADNLKPQLAA